MKPGIDPKVDYAFKKVFGSESNTDLLKNLLEAVLDLPAGGLSNVELLNPFNAKETSDDKLSVLDIKARDASGRWFNVEMQMIAHAALAVRVLYYWAKVYSQQLLEGKDYQQLRPTVSICFIDSRVFPKAEVYRRRFALVDLATMEVLTDHLDIHFVELPKFSMQPDELKTAFEKWCYFLRHGASLDSEQLPTTLSMPGIQRAMEVLMVMSQSELERDRYENRLKWERDLRALEHDRSTALARELAQERQEGIQQGIQEGRQEGIQEGRQEGLVLAQRAMALEEIQFFHRLLKLPPPLSEDLERFSLEDLLHQVTELKDQLLRASS